MFARFSTVCILYLFFFLWKVSKWLKAFLNLLPLYIEYICLNILFDSPTFLLVSLFIKVCLSLSVFSSLLLPTSDDCFWGLLSFQLIEGKCTDVDATSVSIRWSNKCSKNKSKKYHCLDFTYRYTFIWIYLIRSIKICPSKYVRD